MPKLSRRKIAEYYAAELLAGRTPALRLAAYLVESGRVRETSIVIRDVEAALADRGVLVADIESSHELTSEARTAIRAFLTQTTAATTIQLRETTDKTLLGGVKVGIPGRELDATLRQRLNKLKASKI